MFFSYLYVKLKLEELRGPKFRPVKSQKSDLLLLTCRVCLIFSFSPYLRFLEGTDRTCFLSVFQQNYPRSPANKTRNIKTSLFYTKIIYETYASTFEKKPMLKCREALLKP